VHQIPPAQELFVTPVPQQSRIIVEAIPNDDTTIIVPDGAEEGQPEYSRYRVVAVGPGRTLDSGAVVPIPLEVGDEVVFDGRYAVSMTPPGWYGGRKLVVVDYAGVQAKVEREPGETVSRFVQPTIVTPRLVQ
jgi:chaperonin GroES